MATAYDNIRFKLITTRAVMPDGRVITGWYSYPNGATKAEYDRIDAALVKAFGNDGSRTVGTYADRYGDSALKSEQSRRVDAAQPLPCIACGKLLTSAANDPAYDRVPYAGTMFHTGGHYGSTVFDSFDGHKLEIVVCDDCLTAHAKERVTLIAPDKTMRPWDGVTDEA